MKNKNPFFAREYTCPVCMTSFSSLSVRSSAAFVEKRESDFHTIYRGISPFHYSIVVCPTCEYASSSQRFSESLPIGQVQPLSVALIKLKSSDAPYFCEERDLSAVLQAFQLAVRTAQLKKVAAGELAGLLLGTAWIAREMGQTVVEFDYRKEALKYYLEAYQNGSSQIGGLNDLQICYLIGELFRHLQDYPEAVNWFNKVIVHPEIKKNPTIEKAARDQWALAREQAKDNPPHRIPVSRAVRYEATAPGPHPDQPAPQARSSAPDRKLPVQLPLHLSMDQVEWLSLVANSGGKSASHLITREQVIRAILDAAISSCHDQLPHDFSSEQDLKDQFEHLFSS